MIVARPLAVLATLATLALVPVRARGQESLDELLTPWLAKGGLPAVAAAAVRGGEVVAAGAVGTRRAGFAIPVTRDDRFHLGSDTKAMTALLVGMFVEEGALRWDMTLGEALPRHAGQMDAGVRRVTLEQLLSHTSGMPADDDAMGDLLNRAGLHPGNLDEQRAWLLDRWVTRPLARKPGSKFVYANMNYVIAGAVLERASGRTWDELICERVFAPLGLRTAGLGPQSSVGRVDAPLGHERVDGQLVARLAGPNGDNPPVLGPAGIAHMSVLDFARWAGWNAGRGTRGPALVRPETLRKLQTPVHFFDAGPSQPGTPAPKGGYGLGWGEMAVAWAPTPLTCHNGSNTMNYAQVWLDPGRDFAMVLMTNVGGAAADRALNGIAAELFATYSGAPPKPAGGGEAGSKD